MNKSRPINLNLFTIKFPLTAIASILHRISGFVLFLLIPLALWGLDTSLTDTGFDSLHLWSSNFFIKFFIWLCLIPFCYHLVAGIRHLLSDLHIGNSKAGGRIAAITVFIISAVLIIFLGIWLW